jgi:NCS1 family nucleobase:cation symporter-1
MSRCYGQFFLYGSPTKRMSVLMFNRKLYDLLEAIQTHGGNGARAAVFFAAFAFFLSQLCVNVVACGTVGGMDLAALLPRFVWYHIPIFGWRLNIAPRYINIRRGSFIIAFIGICINPWRILNVRHPYSVQTVY